MNDLPGKNATDHRLLHNVRNHLSVIVGYCDLLLAEVPESDRKHADLLEMRNAANAAVALLEHARQDP